MKKQKWVTRSAMAAAAASVLLTLSACGSGGGSAAVATKADPQLAKLVPQDIRTKGTLAGGASFDTRPMNFYAPGNKPDGVILDLLEAAAGKLGLTINWAHIPYDGLIPALQSKRIDIAGAQISKTSEDDGVVNLIAFYQASSGLLVPAGHNYTKDTDACGTRFGLTKGSTINQDTADKINAECKAAGLPALHYLYFNSFNAGADAVRSGRVDSLVNSTPQIQLAVKADRSSLGGTLMGKLAVRATGVALPKEDTQLTRAFQAAFNKMMADGEYASILKKWDLSGMAIKKALVNDQIPAS